MILVRLACAALATIVYTAAALSQDSPEDLPEGLGRDETFYGCTACHGFAIVVQQGMSRDRWDETIAYMIERHAMPPLEGGERQLVVDYLARNWPARMRRGAPNPFLK